MTQKKDAATKQFLSKPEIFADLFNGTFFQGKAILNYHRLHLENNEYFFHGDFGPLKRNRDLIMKESHHIYFRILACEHQSSIHYLMPLRTLEYDALTYRREVTHRQSDIKTWKNSNEFLSKWSPELKIPPVLTLILYCGADPWLIPKNLHDLLDFNDFNTVLKEFVSDYKMHILDVARIKDFSVYHTELQEIFRAIQAASDRTKLKEYLQTSHDKINRLSEEAANMLWELTNNGKNQMNRRENERIGDAMCRAFEQNWELGKTEGKIEGKIQIQQENILELLQVLGPVSPLLKEKILKESDLSVLKLWFGNALHSVSITDFEKKTFS